GDVDDRPDIAHASHRTERIDHRATDGIDNLFSVTGVKYTVARYVAETTVTAIRKRLGRGSPPGIGRERELTGGHIRDGSAFLSEVVRTSGFPEPVARHLAFQYGTRWTQIQALAHAHPEWNRCVAGSREVLLSEIAFAVREEMALHLSDVVLRRTDLGSLGDPGEEALRDCAAVMEKELGWTPEQARKEIEDTRKLFQLPD
ncbi:MAG: glycerol-3-phosphate dehydrogenase C-terminal domain-containing protein, partial [Kiritimatiellia bacterium]|nr:glycerol-3-phosphate dehydrogenase C-terminal domain-containing protein [Kiritimatiellia bacterium]